MNDERVYLTINTLLRTCRIHRNLIEAKIGELGMPRTAHRALMHLSKNGRLMSQRELAEHLEITPAAMSGVLSRLEADGYIERTLGQDTRYNELTITEKGRETVERSRGIFREVDTALFRGFSDAELDAFLTLLEKTKKNAENFEAESGEKQNEKMV